MYSNQILKQGVNKVIKTILKNTWFIGNDVRVAYIGSLENIVVA